MKNVKRPKTEKADERPNEELPLKECRKRVKNNINTLKTTSKVKVTGPGKGGRVSMDFFL